VKVPIDSGLDINVGFDPLELTFGKDMFGPEPELRRLDAIRPSLLNPACGGPDPVYAIAMDVGRPWHRDQLQQRHLLFGVVVYASGQLGAEPVRSQGHIHRISRFSGWSPPEIFEVWQGRALIYMQERAEDDPGRCIVVDARARDRVVVPPAWAHAVVSADPIEPLVFGAWCDRDCGFEYEGVRSHGGLAWFPLLELGAISWKPNSRYLPSAIQIRTAHSYPELGLDSEIPLYTFLDRKPEAIHWVSHPGLKRDVWEHFEP
jgi:glucose-6-phosphate isomerase